MKLNSPIRLFVACSIAASLAGCEASHELGSDCPEDVCPRALGRAEPVCLVRESRTQVGFGSKAEAPNPPPQYRHVVPDEPDDFGTRRFYWVIGSEFELPDGSSLGACDSVPYLEEVDPTNPQVLELQRSFRTDDDPTPLVCLLKQATMSSTGELEGEGWYYGEVLSRGIHRMIRFTSGVPNPPFGATLASMRSVAQTVARNGDLKVTDPGVCSIPEDSAEHEDEVGRSCLPESIPERGFDDSEVLVETGSRACATGACLVYQLAGHPDPECDHQGDPACLKPPQEELRNRAYCSCRCDAPEGDPGELCACNPGFSCVPALLDAPPGIRGSYCVKDGTASVQ